MPFDQNGLATVSSGSGLFSEADAQNAIRGVSVGQVSFANIVDTILREADAAMSVVIDPFNRTVYGVPAASFTEGTVIPHTLATIIKPETGQTGRSLTWEAGSDTGAGVPNKSLYVGTTAAAKPARSVSSEVAALLAAIPDNTAEADQPFIHVDQSNGVIKLIKASARNTARSNLESISVANSVKVGLSEPEGGSSVAPLVFEGGEVA
jgi:hypothetical protein